MKLIKEVNLETTRGLRRRLWTETSCHKPEYQMMIFLLNLLKYIIVIFLFPLLNE